MKDDELPLEAAVPDALNSLGLRRVLRKASGVSGASLIGSVLAVAAGFVAARLLGPARYGDGQFVLLCYLYATLLRSGIFEGSIRAFIDASSRGQDAEAQRAQNVGVTIEMAVSLIPGLLLVAVGLFIGPSVRQLGFFVAPLAVAASSGSTFLSSLWSARDRFDVVTRVALARAAVGPALLVGLVAGVGTAGVFLAPVAADAVCVLLFFLFRPALRLRPSFDIQLARPLLRVGFPLGAAAVIYWAYRLIGSTSVAIAAPAAVLGVYTFAAAPVAITTRAIGGIQAVLLPSVWRELSRGVTGPLWARQAERISVALAVIAGASAGLAQAGFAPVVDAFVPSFAPAIRIFDVLALTIFLLPIATVPSLVLDSERVNRQGRHLIIWFVALLVNLAANALVLTLGWGVEAVATNDVWVQFLVVIVVFETASRYIWGDERRRRVRLYARLAAALGVAVAVTLALDLTATRLQPSGLDVVALLLRCGCTAAIWAGVAALLLGWHRSPERNTKTG